MPVNDQIGTLGFGGTLVLGFLAVAIGAVVGIAGDEKLIDLGLLFAELQHELMGTLLQGTDLDPLPVPGVGFRIIVAPLHVAVMIELQPTGVVFVGVILDACPDVVTVVTVVGDVVNGRSPACCRDGRGDGRCRGGNRDNSLARRRGHI